MIHRLASDRAVPLRIGCLEKSGRPQAQSLIESGGHPFTIVSTPTGNPEMMSLERLQIITA
jgi:hypothetical protein